MKMIALGVRVMKEKKILTIEAITNKCTIMINKSCFCNEFFDNKEKKV
jgi:hypothetical protein